MSAKHFYIFGQRDSKRGQKQVIKFGDFPISDKKSETPLSSRKLPIKKKYWSYRRVENRHKYPLSIWLPSKALPQQQRRGTCPYHPTLCAFRLSHNVANTPRCFLHTLALLSATCVCVVCGHHYRSLTLFLASFSAPASKRTSTIAVWPASEAFMSAVLPYSYTYIEIHNSKKREGEQNKRKKRVRNEQWEVNRKYVSACKITKQNVLEVRKPANWPKNGLCRRRLDGTLSVSY